jgi:hypothetical protein
MREPRVIYSMMLGLIEMSILIMGEMFSIFPSSKALGAGIVFFEPIDMTRRNEIFIFNCTDQSV